MGETSLRLEEFRSLRESAVGYMQEIRQLLSREGETYQEYVCVLQQMEQKLSSDAFDVLIVGEFSSGKTTLINGIMGKAMLPTHISPTTAVINIIRYSAQESARLIFRSAQEQMVPVDALADYITSLSETADARAREIDHVILGFPSPFCRNGVRLVDTPGLNSMHEDHERATMEYLPRGSAGIMAISALQFMSKSQREYLECFRSYMGKMFFLITMVDQMDEDDDFEENEDYFRETLAEVLQRPPDEIKLYPVNAKAAEAGECEGSGLAAFLRDFEAFLTADRLAQEMLSIPVQRVSDYVRQYIAQKQLEMNAVSVPYAEFERRVQEALPQRYAIEQEQILVRGRMSAGVLSCKSRILHHMEYAYRELVQDAAEFVQAYAGDIKQDLSGDLQRFLKKRTVAFSQTVDTYVQREYAALMSELQMASLQLNTMVQDYQKGLGIENVTELNLSDRVIITNDEATLGGIGVAGVVAAVLASVLGPVGVVAAVAASFFGLDSVRQHIIKIGRRNVLQDISAHVRRDLLAHEGSFRRRLADDLDSADAKLLQQLEDSYQEPLRAIERTLTRIRCEQQEAEQDAAWRRSALAADLSCAKQLAERLVHVGGGGVADGGR